MWEKIRVAPTDPARQRRSDPGDPQKCAIYAFHSFVSSDEEIKDCADGCQTARIGCIDCKKILAKNINSLLRRIQEVLTDKSPQRKAAFEQLATFSIQVQREADDADYYAVLASQSRKLQNRLAEIVRCLDFQVSSLSRSGGDETSELMVAIEHYKAFDGAITQTAPLGFLESVEQQAVLDEKGAIRVSLYKVLLFIKIAQAIKGGALNLRHSYKYRSLGPRRLPAFHRVSPSLSWKVLSMGTSR